MYFLIILAQTFSLYIKLLFLNLLRKIKEKKKANEDFKKLKMNIQGNIKESLTLFFPFLSSLSLRSFVIESYTMNYIVEVTRGFMIVFNLSILSKVIP